MISLSILLNTGDVQHVDGRVGGNLMETMRDGGVDELLAMCGGCLSCATCHVYIDPEFLPLLPPVCESEDELLSSIDGREPTSRLSCQIKLTEEMDGLRLRVAPEE